MRFLVPIAAAMLLGCPQSLMPAPTPPTAAERATQQRRGEARAVAFKECMELAAKMPRQADDDVSKIVEECGEQSYYMTNYLQ